MRGVLRRPWLWITCGGMLLGMLQFGISFLGADLFLLVRDIAGYLIYSLLGNVLALLGGVIGGRLGHWHARFSSVPVREG